MAESKKEKFIKKRDEHRAKKQAKLDKKEAKRQARLAKKPTKEQIKEMTGAKKFYWKYFRTFPGFTIFLSLLIVLISETVARKTIFGGVAFLFTSPLEFILNASIIGATLCISLLFNHRAFIYTVISITWQVLGIVNGIILRQRMTPLTTSDIAELKDGLSLMDNYFSHKQIILLMAAVVFCVILAITLFIKLPKHKVQYKKAFITVVLVAAVFMGAMVGAMRVGILDTYFPNLAYGYRDNGFYYCFVTTWLDKGIKEPKNYSAEYISGIFTTDERNTTAPGRNVVPEMDEGVNTPNIIFIQLESFMDPTVVSDIKFSSDPIPNFRALQQGNSSGKLWVPSMGAGTANTELEVMSGISVKFFGPGEYPYKTCLLDETLETVAYDLKPYGYSTHGIHNHRGAFYGRNEVYPNLGYDTFTCLEYMNGIVKTPKNWAKDEILPSQIFDALNSTEGRDYIFTVSVQGHGKYPTEQLLTDPVITVTEAPTEELKWQWEYYANQVYEMDKFVKEMCDEVDTFDEDTIVVFYGDHMPALDNLVDGNFEDGRNIYQTDYMVYANFDMDEVDQDLYSYQIAPVVLDQLGIHNGTFVTYHQNHMDDPNYQENLEALEYDVLYGQKYIYGGVSPYTRTAMQMGVKEIRIDEIVAIGERYYIKGQNFTEYSKISLDGEILDTIYLGPTLLGLKEEVDAGDVVRMRVSQVDDKNRTILSITE